MFDYICCRDESDFNEYAFHSERVFCTVFLVGESLYQRLAEHGCYLRVCDAGHFRVCQDFFNGDGICLAVFRAAVQECYALCVCEQLRRGFKASIAAADNRDIFVRE